MPIQFLLKQFAHLGVYISEASNYDIWDRLSKEEKMKLYSRLIIFVALFTVISITGCQTAYYATWEKLGKEKRHLLRDNVQKASKEQEEASEQFIQKRGGYSILSELAQAPRRFKDLLEKVNVSRGTLASRVKEAEEIGLIEKGIRKSNGSPAYILTDDGKKTKEHGDEQAK